MADGHSNPAELKLALESWLDRHGAPSTVEVRDRATVGLSQETWFVSIDAGEGPVDAVLRLPTPASGNRAILVQRAALELMSGHIPSPELLWFDDEETNELGKPFLVMARARGEVPVGWHELPEPRRTRLAEAAIDVLADLHAVDPSGLRSAVPPRPSVACDAGFYRRRFDKLGEIPVALRTALWWLDRHEPPPSRRVSLVHGDYRMGNLVVDGERITGVLDWEMAAPGDPVADLAWCFIPVWMPAGVDEEPLIQRYSERSSEPFDADRYHYYRVLGFVRMAYYALAGVAAFESGASRDLRLAALRLQLPVHLDRMMATLTGEDYR